MFLTLYHLDLFQDVITSGSCPIIPPTPDGKLIDKRKFVNLCNCKGGSTHFTGKGFILKLMCCLIHVTSVAFCPRYYLGQSPK